MFRPLNSPHRRPPRRGTAVLITCFFLITVMMVTGLALMMYAAREKAAALAYQEASAGVVRMSPSPEATVNTFLGALIYDTADDGADLQNALRGHSLARAMYGGLPGSVTPWAGVGTFAEDAGTYTFAGTNRYPSLAGLNRTQIVNHTLLTVDNHTLVVDPEWTGSRGDAAPGNPPPFNNGTGRNYVGKHAGYTYPDLKNFFLAARDPATGAILTPSFHREWLFGTLAPNNPNWNNPNQIGKLLTLRPRPAEHPNFPRVPANEDGTYTGDVQNAPGAYVFVPNVGGPGGRFVARNDSLWMHIGLAPITMENGRVLQPLVAPLILPMDGHFDLSKHGNLLGGTATAPLHASYAGHGPWEINPAYGLTAPGNAGTAPVGNAEIQALLNPRATTRQSPFAPYLAPQQLPRYAPVNWTAAAVSFQLPAGADLTGEPSWADPALVPPFGGYQNDNAAVAGHPAGYNPNDFAARSDVAPSTPVFPFTDLKRYGQRFAFAPDWYGQAFSAQPGAAPALFRGDGATYPFRPTGDPGPPAVAHRDRQSNYRLDPAHTRRNLFTVRTNGLDRPALAPLFTDRGPGSALQVVAGQLKPAALPPVLSGSPYPAPGALGTAADFQAQNRWVNALAALGAVDLNRPLADYRGTDPAALALPLSATNVAGAAQADADRQALARDIFARLVVATGAAANVDPTTGTVTPIATPADGPAFNALRYLAQVAVNLVDFIDNDDVSTTFVWNPTDPLAPLANLATDLDLASVGDRAVFGVEKPRLVINEAYSEVVNDPNDPVNGNNGNGKNDPPAGPAHVRFWLELLNPSLLPTAATGVLGDGSVNLSAFRVEIRRAQRQTAVGNGQDDPTPTGQSDFLFLNPANPTGSFDLSRGAPDAVFTFPAAPAAGRPGVIAPNNGTYNPATAANTDLPPNGFVLVGPPTTNRGDDFNPNGGVWQNQNKVESPDPTDAPNSPAMGYRMPLPMNQADATAPEFKRNIVLLRRLANPHLPAGPTNPYVTVDVMDYVPTFDAIHRLRGGGTNRNPRAAMNANPNGYDPAGDRFSVGKVQPLAGLSVATVRGGPNTPNTYTFPASMVLAQTAANGGNQPRHTFGRHNGTGNAAPGAATVDATASPATISDTIMLPFDWHPHPDRPLVNAGDVFLARDCPPHRLTHEFVTAGAGTPSLSYAASSPRWDQHGTGLARALELLRVKSPQDFAGHGGRVGGRVNLNAVQDQRVVQGIWDAPPVGATTGNRFDINFVNTNVWTQFMGSRSALQNKFRTDGLATFTAPMPGVGALDRPVPPGPPPATPPDRPVLPFGAPALGANGSFAYFNPTAGGEGDTLLRRDPANPANPPLLFNADPARTQNHPYLQSEPLRKVLNNTTTVSHQFIVYLTIGYFEATATGNAAQPFQFGAEAYNLIPGDMRQKFVAVVDMSSMGVQPNNTTQHAQGQPFFTSLTRTARVGDTSIQVAFTPGTTATNWTISHDGNQVQPSTTSPLVIGYGADAQVVQVARVDPNGTLTLQAPLTRDAWGGSVVSNVRPGYAGPQPGFSVTDVRYRPVVPYIERVQ